jgi:CheY-like chemotaxis protein
VIDDEEAVVATVSGQLRSLGYAPTGATDSRAALALFRSDPDAFDLVLTDYTMPHVTGLELAGRIREIRPHTPIVLMSGLSHSVDDAHARGAVDGVLGKPFHGTELAAVIRSALAERPVHPH